SRVRARLYQWVRRAFFSVLFVSINAGLVGWIGQPYLKEQMNWFMIMRPYMVASVRPYVLTADAERTLKPGETFKECGKVCPAMVVVPAGNFTMGSPPTEKNRWPNEAPQHGVTIARPFAVSKFELTFVEWEACVSVGGCPPPEYADFEQEA